VDLLPVSAAQDARRRFDRQIRFAPLGEAGQGRISGARVLLAGCGALGGSLAQTLVRCGVGTLVVVDRDVVELSNLPRQVLFEERHLGAPKAEAAREALAAIGGPTRVEAHAAHLDADNLDELAEGAALLLDGTDNLATRYLLNDYAVERGIPWIYGGVVGGSGLVLAVLPGRGACLRCLFPDPPAPGSLATCDTAGVILPAVSAVASFQAGAALRLLAAGDEERARFEPQLVELDPWTPEVRRLPAPRDPDCPCCGAGEFPFLREGARSTAISLCGRNTVQVRPAMPTATGRPRADLARLAERVRSLASDVRDLGSILRFDADGCRVTVFADGRALIEGTSDLDRARALYDRFVGS
jgi:molybdopterin/thiamine biosynthesis adenylyltransferase